MNILEYPNKLMPANIIDQASLALIIDPWVLPHPGIENFYQHVRQVCSQNTNIQAVSLSSFILDKTIYQDEPWFSEAKHLFCDTTKLDALRCDWQTFDFLNTWDGNADKTTHPVICQMRARSDQVFVGIYNIWQLVYYCNFVNPGIRNIIMMGCAWDRCVEKRPVGWREISYAMHYGLFANKINILTFQDCVLDSKCCTPNIVDPWIQREGNVYQLDLAKVSVNV